MKYDITAEGVLEDVKRLKYNLSPEAVDRIILTIWHDLEVPYARSRIQIYFLLMLYVISGARISALITS